MCLPDFGLKKNRFNYLNKRTFCLPTELEKFPINNVCFDRGEHKKKLIILLFIQRKLLEINLEKHFVVSLIQYTTKRYGFLKRNKEKSDFQFTLLCNPLS